MKTPNLFDVPKTAPSKRERLRAFKEAHEITTQLCHEDEAPWLAVLMPAARKIAMDYGDPTSGKGDEEEMLELLWGFCRLMDEQGLTGCGKTEREAIRELCAKNDIQCTI